MSTPTFKLMKDLEEKTKMFISKAEYLLSLSAHQLQQRPENGGWNALECIEHLNRYGEFYLPEISKRITQSTFPPSAVFKPGIIGNYFTKSMEPKEGTKKMKTFKDKDPIHSSLNKKCIETFIAQQHQMLELLQSARKVDLNKTKTSISITKLLTLKLGDTFRFLAAHNERHIVQAFAAVNSLKIFASPAS